MKKIIKYLSIGICWLSTMSCQTSNKSQDDLGFDVEESLRYCVSQAARTLATVQRDSVFPRTIPLGDTAWRYVKIADWTSGFWPGILWYLYEYTGEDQWKVAADRYSRYLVPLSENAAFDHDLGFQIYCSFGNGYRLTQDSFYKSVILRTADTLATLYNPSVGTILSWPFRTEEWGPHNTIIDNLMNLEMLLWACKEGGDDALCDMANQHARITLENQFRDDFTSYHIVAYDNAGEAVKKGTFQGYADESTWARGQAWAIYGYVIMYRETGDSRYLDFLREVTKVYLDKLPEDAVPYWDFDDPSIPAAPRDASSAAIVASALLDLSDILDNADEQNYYREWAIRMLRSLSSEAYRSNEQNNAFLLHSTGSKTSEIDVSINYADYYYLEALMRLYKSTKN